MPTITLDQAIMWTGNLQQTGRYGFLPENRRCAKIIRDDIKDNFATHSGPDGTPWPRTELDTDKSIIYVGMIGRVGKKEFRVRHMGEARALAKFYNTSSRNRKRYRARRRAKFIPPQPALFRRGVRRMRDKMTRSSAPGHISQIWRTGLRVGGYGESLVDHQEGNPARGLPARPFAGVTERMASQCAEVYAQGVMKRLDKGMF